MSRRLVRILATTAAMMIVQAAHSGGEPPEYEVDVIPGPFCGIFGWEPAVGLGINELGHICGYNFDCNNDNEPFFWSPKTGRVTLDVPVGFNYSTDDHRGVSHRDVPRGLWVAKTSSGRLLGTG